MVLHEVSSYIVMGFLLLIVYYHSAIWDICFSLHFTAVRVHHSLSLKMPVFLTDVF